MKNILAICVSLFCLLSCKSGYIYKEKDINSARANLNKQSESTTVKIQRCLFRCEQLFKTCQSQCHDSCLQCQKQADKEAWENYQSYYRQMKAQGTYRPRDWLSFRDPLQCRKITCSCTGDLNVCAQQCGGKIEKKLRVTPYCE